MRRKFIAAAGPDHDHLPAPGGNWTMLAASR
jgi:hypothetical protein